MSAPRVPEVSSHVDANELPRREAASPSPVDPDFQGGIDIGHPEGGEATASPETAPINQSGTSGSSGQ